MKERENGLRRWNWQSKIKILFVKLNYFMRKLLLIFVVLLAAISLQAQTDSVGYPNIKFDGSLKNKFEYATSEDMSRFSIRNSRVGVKGDINDFAGFRAQIELSDEGEFKVLDLSGIFTPFKGMTLTFGQTSIPLFNPYVVSPSEMMFANRAFIGKYFLSTRDLGINAKYRFGIGDMPVQLEAGAYNGNAINDPVWKNSLSYGGRLQLGSMEGLRFTAKIYDYKNSEERHHLFYGADLRYEVDRFKIETEIMKRDSKTEFYNDLLAYYVQTSYRFPIKTRYFNYFLPAVRWDGIDEQLNVSGFDTNRLTVGLGIGTDNSLFSSILRLDYEWYFRNNEMSVFDPANYQDSDKLTVELLITF